MQLAWGEQVVDTGLFLLCGVGVICDMIYLMSGIDVHDLSSQFVTRVVLARLLGIALIRGCDGRELKAMADPLFKEMSKLGECDEALVSNPNIFLHTSLVFPHNVPSQAKLAAIFTENAHDNTKYLLSEYGDGDGGHSAVARDFDPRTRIISYYKGITPLPTLCITQSECGMLC